MQEKNPEAEIEGYAHKKKRLKQNKMENSQCKLRVAVDCSFDTLMDDNGKEKKKQGQYCSTLKLEFNGISLIHTLQ